LSPIAWRRSSAKLERVVILDSMAASRLISGPERPASHRQ
jgi:hypothetical protein